MRGPKIGDPDDILKRNEPEEGKVMLLTRRSAMSGSAGLFFAGCAGLRSDPAEAFWAMIAEYAIAVGAGLTVEFIKWLAGQNEPTRKTIEQTNRGLPSGSDFSALSNTPVYRTRDSAFYPVRQYGPIPNFWAPLYRRPVRRWVYHPEYGSSCYETVYEPLSYFCGPSTVGLTNAAWELRNRGCSVDEVHDLLMPDTPMQGGYPGVFERDFDTPKTYRSRAGTVRINYAEKGNGEGSVSVHAARDGEIVHNRIYDLTYA